MDEWKVTPIREWVPPQTIKELQWFLGFTIFYCRFVRNFSQVAALLTSLICGRGSYLHWNPEADFALQRLKEAPCSAPILHQPRPEDPFEIEVDASEAGVGGILIQQDPVTGR